MGLKLKGIAESVAAECGDKGAVWEVNHTPESGWTA
jgi:hypothetical protein